VSTSAATVVEFLSRPATVRDGRIDPARLSLALSSHCLVETLDQIAKNADRTQQEEDTDHIASGLELDLYSGLDAIAIGDGLGNGDL